MRPTRLTAPGRQMRQLLRQTRGGAMTTGDEPPKPVSDFIDAYVFELTSRLAGIKNRIETEGTDPELLAALDHILDQLERIEELVAVARRKRDGS